VRYFVLPAEDHRLDAQARRHLRGSFIELSDGVTHYELCGPDGGDLVVLVGGMTIPLFYWDAFASQLHERGLRTLAYSAYGRGYSDRVHARYDEALFVRQLRDLTTALDLPTQTHLVGTSMGALIAAAFLDKYASSIATLTLVGPAGLSNATARQQQLLRSDLIATFVAKRFGSRILLGHLGRNVADQALAVDLAAMIAECYRYEGSMYAFFSTLQQFPLSGRAESYRRAGAHAVPTMLAWGAQDQVTPITAFDQAVALLKPETTHVIEHCGHMAPYERPAEVADQLAAFIAYQQPSDRTTS
jgi:pimeloyl-ACP methyl ester carboxylesterase